MWNTSMFPLAGISTGLIDNSIKNLPFELLSTFVCSIRLGDKMNRISTSIHISKSLQQSDLNSIPFNIISRRQRWIITVIILEESNCLYHPCLYCSSCNYKLHFGCCNSLLGDTLWSSLQARLPSKRWQIKIKGLKQFD